MIRKLTLATVLAASIPLAFTGNPADAAPVFAGSEIQTKSGGELTGPMTFGDPATGQPDAFVGILGAVWSMLQDGQGQPPQDDPITDPSDSITQVPEPGTLALLGAGLVGLAVLRRRKAA